MRLTLAAVTPRKQRLKSSAVRELVEDYVQRTARYCPASLAFFDTEESLLASVARTAGRTAPFVVLCDSRGKPLTSEAFAESIRAVRDGGTQELLLAVGPANGWSAEARSRANLLLSFGAMTLAHELALAVLAEQMYRAQTILAGHPYHDGH
jgi:23S rRNA (pseudouridine1915-N3)-methyltransferase